MAEINSIFGGTLSGATDGAAGVRRLAGMSNDTGALARFQQALENASASSAVSSGANAPVELRTAQVATPGSVGRASEVQPSDGVQPSKESSQNVLKSLDIESTTKPADASSTGDLILGGLKKLRGMFDAQHTNMNAMMDKPTADSTQLLAMQVEVVKYSLLIDVASKLTGKSTQSFDTLMKGQ